MVKNKDVLHDVCLTTGDDTCSLDETPVLITRYFPNVPLRAPLAGYPTLYSNEKAKRVLGYRRQYTWRHGNFSAWPESQKA